MKNNVSIFTKNGMFASLAIDKVTGGIIIGRSDTRCTPATAHLFFSQKKAAIEMNQAKIDLTIQNGWTIAYQGKRNFG